MTTWIPTAERVPDVPRIVWTFGAWGWPCLGYYATSDREWHDAQGDDLMTVTHWMPADIPAPPT